jgi:hypothetical protein
LDPLATFPAGTESSGAVRVTRRLIDATNYPADPPGSSNPG